MKKYEIESTKSVRRYHGMAIEQADNYFRHCNQTIGVAGFATALGCVGLELSSVFSWVSLFFLMLVWSDDLSNYRKHVATLRLLNSVEVKWLSVLCRTRIAIFGVVALASVAVGLVDKSGLA